MMTTMAALLGALPLALGHGTGSELRQPLGVTMVGGLIFSQAMTLFTTPVVYLYLDRLQNRRHKRGARVRTPEQAVAAALGAAGTPDGSPPSVAHGRRAGSGLDDAEPEGAA